MTSPMNPINPTDATNATTWTSASDSADPARATRSARSGAGRRRTLPGRRRAAAVTTGGLAAALVLASPVAASAHVHVTPSSTQAGATSMLEFSFSHGCDGSPTTAVEVTVPDEIASVALIANPGWDVASELVDGVRTVVFTADEPMPDGVRETLEVEVTLPEDAADGTVLAFPALQVCETGETLWGELEADSETPAPTLTIGEAADAHGHGGDAGHGTDGTGSGDAGHGEDHAEAAPGDAGAAAEQPSRDTAAAMPLAITALVVAVLAAGLAAFAVFRRRA